VQAVEGGKAASIERVVHPYFRRQSSSLADTDSGVLDLICRTAAASGGPQCVVEGRVRKSGKGVTVDLRGGSEVTVALADEMVVEFLTHVHPERPCWAPVACPTRLMGRVIGKQGRNLGEVQAQTGARVRGGRDDLPLSALYVTGEDAGAVSAAVTAITALVDQAREAERRAAARKLKPAPPAPSPESPTSAPAKAEAQPRGILHWAQAQVKAQAKRG
jgi:hypothetical protein